MCLEVVCEIQPQREEGPRKTCWYSRITLFHLSKWESKQGQQEACVDEPGAPYWTWTWNGIMYELEVGIRRTREGQSYCLILQEQELEKPRLTWSWVRQGSRSATRNDSTSTWVSKRRLKKTLACSWMGINGVEKAKVLIFFCLSV